MKRSEFRQNVASLVDDAIEQGLTRHTIEKTLQQEEQNIREDRRVYNIFTYECTHTNCEESTTQMIDQIDLQCDICEKPLTIFESTDVGDSDRMKFHCEDHDTVRVHDFSFEETTCPIHNDSMELLGSYMTEEGLGD